MEHCIKSVCLSLFLILTFTKTALSDEITIPVSDDNELTVETYPANGRILLIWIAPEYGFRQNHRQLAKTLSSLGNEVWQSNILESLFLTQSTHTQRQLDGRYIADLVEYAHKKTGKDIILVGDSYAAASALIGAHQWQTRSQPPYLKGAVLFSPYAYSYIPPLGMPPEYLPVINATNIPLIIYQASNSGIIGQFKILSSKLQQHDNPAYIKNIPGIMSLFYQKEPTNEMKKGATLVADSFNKMVSLLSKHPLPAKPVSLKTITTESTGIDIYLKDFKGKATPLAIKLYDTNGDSFTKDDYKNKVTVINFWATWCPPCIEEIPSLNRLKNKMKGPDFELISINYAEDTDVIQQFMKKINVEFTVLLDHSGEFAKKWNVVSYPSTFIINKQGKVVYGVNAAIEWDSPEVIDKLRALQ